MVARQASLTTGQMSHYLCLAPDPANIMYIIQIEWIINNVSDSSSEKLTPFVALNLLTGVDSGTCVWGGGVIRPFFVLKGSWMFTHHHYLPTTFVCMSLFLDITGKINKCHVGLNVLIWPRQPICTNINS